MDDLRRKNYGSVILFLGMALGFIYLSGCGAMQGQSSIARTPIPTLIPATLPAPQQSLPVPTSVPTETPSAVAPTEPPASDIARPSNPGGPSQAISLKGDAVSGKMIFANNCEVCHGLEGVGNNPNPGSDDGTIPPLNPIDATIKDPDYKTFAINLDLFIEHGSTPAGENPTFRMPPWGEKGWLTPQQIADAIAYLISLNP